MMDESSQLLTTRKMMQVELENLSKISYTMGTFVRQTSRKASLGRSTPCNRVPY